MCIMKSSEWHQTSDANLKPYRYLWWSCQTASQLLIRVIRLLLLSPRAKTTRVICRVFCIWRLHNAARRWLCVGIPCYTSELEQGRWAKNRAEWFGRKSKKSVQCDAMTWLRRGSYPQAGRNLILMR
jgi:hypothetical protein